jgi:urease accessory protein
MKANPRSRLLALLFLATASVAEAHPGHGPTVGFSAGFEHPFSGWDHLLAMVAVGLWATQVGGIAGVLPPGVDGFILASVFTLGALVSFSVKLPVWCGACIVALAGVFHGIAHGAEIPRDGTGLGGLLGLAGMVVATGLLHAVGVSIGLKAGPRRAAVVRLGGAAILAGGLALCLA